LPTSGSSGTIQGMPNLMPEITAVLLLAVVVLWATFAFFLGPSLWKTHRGAFAFDLTVAGIIYGWFLFHLPPLVWFVENFPLLGKWGATEWLALAALLATLLGLGLTALFTYRSSQSAQKLLENELRAALDVPPNSQERSGSQGGGLLAEGVQNLEDGGPHLSMSGFVRNIGRFVARDIELTPFLGKRQGRVKNSPPQTLFPDASEAQFDIHVPFSPVDANDPNRSMAELFASGEQTRLVFTFKDGNPHADPYEVCFTFAPGDKPDTWVSTKVPCADAEARR
jgi:hypothetical protein